MDERCSAGSWKIIATWLRYRRRSAPASSLTSVPPNRIEPWTSAPRGSSRSIARAVIDLPDPNSPTRPTASPGRTVSETSHSTARLVWSASSSTVSPAISSSGAPGCPRWAPACWPLAGLALARSSAVRLCLLEQPLAEYVDRDHHDHDAHPGGERGQRVALQDAGLVLRDHHAPVGGGRLDPEAEERDGGQVDHGVPEQDGRLRDDQGRDVRDEVPQADRSGRCPLHLQGRGVGL